MRDAAYGLLTAEDRAASHAGAARFLEGTGEDAAIIAAHYEGAADLRQAVRCYTVAAEQAYRRSDLAAAVSLLSRGLACGATGEERGTLLSLDAYARFFQHDFAASWTSSTEALGLLPRGHARRPHSLSSHMYAAVHLGKSVDMAAIADEMLAQDPGQQHRADHVDSLGYACISYAATGNRGPAARLVDRIAALDVGDGDPLVSAHVCYWRTRLLQLLGDDPYAAWIVAQQGVRCYERSGDRRMHSFMQAEVGECARRLFSVTEGAATMRQAIELGSQLREPVTTAFLQQYLATLLAEHGAAEDLAEARALALSVLELAPGGAYHALGQISMALVSLRDGDLKEAERVARAAHATIHGIGLGGYFPHADAALLQVLTRAGDVAGAAELADAAMLVVENQGPMGLMDIPLRLHIARAHLAADRRADATRGVDKALACLDRQAAKIPDLALRARLATDVPEHVSLNALARELEVPTSHSG
jgi:tetratricopeptide (TPR) repeat protein